MDLGISPDAIAKSLLVLRQNEVPNVTILSAFSSEEDLERLKAKNDHGEEVALGAGTVAALWRFVQERRRTSKSAFQFHNIFKKLE